MRDFKNLLLISCLAIAAPSQIWAKDLSQADNIDRVVAVVNSEIITDSEVVEQMNAIKHEFLAHGKTLPEDSVLRKKIVDQLVYKKLQLQVAKRAELKIEQDEMTAAMNEIAKRNHMDLAEMRKQMEAQGVEYKQFREDLKTQLLLQKLQQRSLASKVNVTDKEVKEAQQKMLSELGDKNEYHLADILISLPDEPSSDQILKAKQKAQKIMSEIEQGGDFTKIATKQSDAQESLDGGDMGWRQIAGIPSLFADKVKRMNEGDVRGPIRAPNGFHIIKLLGIKTDAKNPSVAEVKNMIFQRKMNEQLNDWLHELRDSSYVKIIS